MLLLTPLKYLQLFSGTPCIILVEVATLVRTVHDVLTETKFCVTYGIALSTK